VGLGTKHRGELREAIKSSFGKGRLVGHKKVGTGSSDIKVIVPVAQAIERNGGLTPLLETEHESGWVRMAEMGIQPLAAADHAALRPISLQRKQFQW
jgi:hypothetical protein